MLKPQQLHEYQKEAVLHQLYHDESMLWLQVGLGKSVITLTTIVDRMRAGQVKKTLIFGPLRVIQAVWARETKKWTHTQHLRCSVMHGTKDKRLRALFTDADIYLINYESMNWLAETLDHYYLSQGKPLPFQMVVYDEVSKLKNSTSLRMKGGKRDRKDRNGEMHQINVTGWRKIIPHVPIRTGLTGTPASNGYLDLHGQYLAVDNGKRLGQYVTHYRDDFFESDYMGWSYKPTDAGKQRIESLINDVTIKMDSKDYLDMPAVKVTNLLVDMPAKTRKWYEEIEKDMFTKLESGRELEVFSRSSVSNKCLQLCIAEGTEVLTDSGWKLIENFKEGDRVWDGVEWASVYSLAFQGIKPVIEFDGVWMTPDHKVLTNSGWKEAQEITHGNAGKRFNRTKVRLPDSHKEDGVYRGHKIKKSHMVSEVCLRERIYCNRSESEKPKQAGREVVRMQERRGDNVSDRQSRNEQYSRIRDLDKHAVSLPKPKRQGLSKLWRTWNKDLRPMVRLIRGVLGGHGSTIQRQSAHREIEQQWELCSGKLPMGDNGASVQQQKEFCLYRDTARKNDARSSSQKVWVKGRDNSSKVFEGFTRTGIDSPVKKLAKVYDLINAGKRNRFTVRGKDGEILIVHNCNGSPYFPDSTEFEAVHDAKLDALDDVLEEAAGSPVLCSYTFKSDAARIMQKFKKYKPVNLSNVPSKDTEKVINDWIDGNIKLLIAHPASLGHGIDGLQESGNIIVWFGLNWSLELYEQMNGRLNRQGQKRPVSIIRILCRDTVDLAVADALERKTDDQEGLKAALQRYRDGITNNELEVNFF